MNSFDLFNCLTRQSSIEILHSRDFVLPGEQWIRFLGSNALGQDGTGEENQVSYPKA